MAVRAVSLCCFFLIFLTLASTGVRAGKKDAKVKYRPSADEKIELPASPEVKDHRRAQETTEPAADEQAASERLKMRRSSRVPPKRGHLGLWKRIPRPVRILINAALIIVIVAALSKTRQVKKGCQTCMFKPKKKQGNLATKAGPLKAKKERL
ncbi:hypothetical protein CSUI_004906 [Cystoisospora suis]|uniref:Transmembrane protein n=1 Tax=Cystoisospora suis TaxID=483139 RepID=A0A2C6KX16_9APIC|nr:hypothetical protein CSUI_004906 [Cystoisospora suis]